MNRNTVQFGRITPAGDLAERGPALALGVLLETHGMKPTRCAYAAGIIERHDNSLLIVLPAEQVEGARCWRFPRGSVREGEPPEAAMRRIAKEQLGFAVEIVVGQPPVMTNLEGAEVEMRYFFCGVEYGEPQPIAYAELRWVLKGQLREYEFDDASKAIVDWLLETG